ncbi:MAG: tetratricopeptide repeat protein [Chloroflexales bacterium]|nr:tetratricopeptide repeat protein [Chloroflexales bacterium]
MSNHQFDDQVPQDESGKQVPRGARGAGAWPSDKTVPRGMSPLAWVGGGVLLVLGLLAGIFVAPLFRAPSEPTPTAGLASEATATPLQSATSVTSTSDPSPSATTPPDLNELYTAGREAAQAGDWELAVRSFSSVFAANADYNDIRQQLTDSYYGWGVALLREKQLDEARDKFNRAAGLSPEHGLTAQKKRLIGLFDHAEELFGRASYDEVIATLLPEAPIAEDFPQLTDLLLRAHIESSRALLSQTPPGAGQAQAALATAAALPNLDDAQRAVVGGLQAEVAALLPTPTPSPVAPPPTPVPAKKLRMVRANQNDTPTCISIRVTGISTAGWYFIADALQIRGNFDTGGNARNCDLGYNQEFSFTIYNADGQAVKGGGGVRARGGDIFVGEWK